MGALIDFPFDSEPLRDVWAQVSLRLKKSADAALIPGEMRYRIEGVASALFRDVDGEVVDPAAVVRAIPLYMAPRGDGSIKGGPIYWNHRDDLPPLGRCTRIWVQGGKTRFEAELDGENPKAVQIYRQIKNGVVHFGVSLGGEKFRWVVRVLHGKASRWITQIRLDELSITPNEAVRGLEPVDGLYSTYVLAKSAGRVKDLTPIRIGDGPDDLIWCDAMGYVLHKGKRAGPDGDDDRQLGMFGDWKAEDHPRIEGGEKGGQFAAKGEGTVSADHNAIEQDIRASRPVSEKYGFPMGAAQSDDSLKQFAAALFKLNGTLTALSAKREAAEHAMADVWAKIEGLLRQHREENPRRLALPPGVRELRDQETALREQVRGYDGQWQATWDDLMTLQRENPVAHAEVVRRWMAPDDMGTTGPKPADWGQPKYAAMEGEKDFVTWAGPATALGRHAIVTLGDGVTWEFVPADPAKPTRQAGTRWTGDDAIASAATSAWTDQADQADAERDRMTAEAAAAAVPPQPVPPALPAVWRGPVPTGWGGLPMPWEMTLEEFLERPPGVQPPGMDDVPETARRGAEFDAYKEAERAQAEAWSKLKSGDKAGYAAAEHKATEARVAWQRAHDAAWHASAVAWAESQGKPIPDHVKSDKGVWSNPEFVAAAERNGQWLADAKAKRTPEDWELPRQAWAVRNAGARSAPAWADHVGQVQPLAKPEKRERVVMRDGSVWEHQGMTGHREAVYPGWVNVTDEVTKAHKSAVRRAVVAGHPVPRSVLEDYPDLMGSGMRKSAKASGGVMKVEHEGQVYDVMANGDMVLVEPLKKSAGQPDPEPEQERDDEEEPKPETETASEADEDDDDDADNLREARMMRDNTGNIIPIH